MLIYVLIVYKLGFQSSNYSSLISIYLFKVLLIQPCLNSSLYYLLRTLMKARQCVILSIAPICY